MAISQSRNQFGLPKRKSTLSFIFTWHVRSMVQKAYPLKHVKKMIYWMLFEKRVVNKARSVVFTCEEEKLLARESFPFYTPNESVTAYGTAGSTFERSSSVEAFYASHPELRDKKLILFVGRIHEKKAVIFY